MLLQQGLSGGSPNIAGQGYAVPPANALTALRGGSVVTNPASPFVGAATLFRYEFANKGWTAINTGVVPNAFSVLRQQGLVELALIGVGGVAATVTQDHTYDQFVTTDIPNATHYYPLDETSGAVTFDKVGTTNGTILGGVTLGNAGFVDNNFAYGFNGINGEVVFTTILIPAVFNSWALDFWFNASVIGGTLMQLCDDTTIFLYAPDNTLRITYAGAGVGVPGLIIGNVVPNTWYYAQVCYDGFIDYGVLLNGVGGFSGGAEPNVSGTGATTFGNGNKGAFNGLLQKVGFYQPCVPSNYVLGSTGSSGGATASIFGIDALDIHTPLQTVPGITYRTRPIRVPDAAPRGTRIRLRRTRIYGSGTILSGTITATTENGVSVAPLTTTVPLPLQAQGFLAVQEWPPSVVGRMVDVTLEGLIGTGIVITHVEQDYTLVG